MTDETEADRKFKVGDKVRENRVGAAVETVIAVNHPMVTTDRNLYHHTKIVKVRDAE